MNEIIDIYVINLAHRTDRKEIFLESYKEYTNINFIFVEAISNNNGAIGCFMSHQKCIEIAKEKNLDYLIVMEDDTIPKENINFYQEVINIKKFLDNNNFNLFFGVANKVRLENIKDIIEDNITCAIVDKSYVFNFVVFNKNIYDFFLSADPTIEPIDKYWNYKITAHVKVPFIVETYKNYSNIVKKQTNYSKQFQNTEDFIISYINNKNQVNI